MSSVENEQSNLVEFYSDRVLSELETMVNNQAVTPTNVLMFSLSLMQVVEGFPDLKGKQKKELVLNVFDRYLEKYKGDKTLLQLLPSFIDTSIGLDRGEVTIKISSEDISSCCGSLSKIFVKNKIEKKNQA